MPDPSEYGPPTGEVEILRIADIVSAAFAIAPDDAHIVEKMYRTRAAMSSGPLDRGLYIWHRIREPRGETARAYLVEFDGTPEGYLYYVQKKSDAAAPFDLHVSDLIALTS